ncbi:MAG TPA: nucleoside-diphosphate sugar epimerase/dehydratase [Nocardioides sp.]|uniref:nucleoside-diphosphate sugar epimerase/dehydratase n=1 Tax=Nocardioides sp. TaxID=35761 RepID=UPI002E355AD7|nr:nucleoside-diphosphate sugar epimerase/dehydratase [Nocardioides sp.]HEX3932483.1 nucleoside-diphosphate sugar epimerase/dehydratase [Nocardioides sp.]
MGHLRTHRALTLAGVDTTCWALAYLTMLSYRMVDGGDFDRYPAYHALVLALLSAAVHLAVSWPQRFHQGRTIAGSFDDMVMLARIALAVGVVVTLVNLPLVYVPRSVPPAASVTALVLMGTARGIYRAWHERQLLFASSGVSVPVLVAGAGDAGQQLVRSMLRDPARRWTPVGLLDDDPRKRNLVVGGVPVLGRTDQLAARSVTTGVSEMVIAIPSATSAQIRRLADLAFEADVRAKVLPGLDDLIDQGVAISDIRDINVADLLGRHQVDTDLASIAGYLSGKRVLVTGAGGSIGSELCRQIQRWDPAELIMLDRDESGLHSVQLSVSGHGLLDSSDVVLNNIRDYDALLDVFRTRRPEVVFHAAALKHLPLLEQYPAEAVKTNVIGTANVLEAAQDVGVDRFVNISTDKAADPTCVLGSSKRVAERLTAGVADSASGTYLSVRFGNVLGSRGSVLSSFAAQIAAGGPVTVTDPEVTRYFMTIEEAVQLVIQAGAIGRRGEALVLDMGEPVSIQSVAEHLIRQAGRPMKIVHTGLRPGEKLHEQVFGAGEPDERPIHPLISHVQVPPLALGTVRTEATVTATLARELIDAWSSSQTQDGVGVQR